MNNKLYCPGAGKRRNSLKKNLFQPMCAEEKHKIWEQSKINNNNNNNNQKNTLITIIIP